MSDEDGLIWAYRVDAGGGSESVGWSELAPPEEGYVWIHLDLNAPRTKEWLAGDSELPDLEASAMLAEETRPRATRIADGLLVNLRGVNLNPGADPEDMVSIRVWASEKRVITVGRRKLLALQEVRDLVVRNRGATTTGEFLAELSGRLVERMANVIGELDDNLDDIEENLGEMDSGTARSRLVELRRQAIALRRYISPQREALARLSNERLPWIQEGERMEIREVSDRTTRYVEDLESARERAAVAQEELASHLSEQLNRRMYALSIIAGIFLPLSFATGLLGINVSGIPGAATDWAFAAVCVLLALLAAAELLVFRRLRWL